jgi:hypothetical protein
MPEDIKPRDVPVVKKFYDKCRESLRPSDPPHFCPFCGIVKQEFENPMTGRIVLLDCECEQKVRMFKDFIENYRECDTSKRNAHGALIEGVKYRELIDGTKRPANEDEERIVYIGRMVQALIQNADHITSRR